MAPAAMMTMMVGSSACNLGSNRSHVFGTNIRSLPILTISNRPSRASLSARSATSIATKFTTLKPLGDRVLVQIESTEEKTSGGILLPVAAQSKPQSGQVVSVGDGKSFGDKKLEPSVQQGSNVVYSKYAGTEIEFNGVNHLLLKEDDILGFLDTDDIRDLKPLHDRVLIEIAESEDKSAGGVLLTTASKEKPIVGTVKAVGPGTYCEDGTQKPLDIILGNSVMYSRYIGHEFKSKDGKEFVVIKAMDILAVLP